MNLIIQIIYNFDKNGFHDQATDTLFNYIYDILIIPNNHKQCDLLMEFFLQNNFSIKTMTSFARITKPHKDKLVNREKLITQLSEKLYEECSTKEAESVLFHIT